jgi:hypothetical protein
VEGFAMNKTNLIILIIINLVFILLSGCSQSVTGKEPPTITPTPIPPLLTRDANNPEYYYIDRANLENMAISPRDLTQPENETLIRIALNVDPVREKINQGMSYRTKIGWITYNKSNISPWDFYSYIFKDIPKKTIKNDIIFPAVEIGLGTPQQYFMRVAVDLNSEKAAYASVTVDKHVAVPSYVKPLTEEEKTKLIEIGSTAPDFKTFVGNNEYTIDFQWVAISQSGGYIAGLDYDIFEKGIENNVPLESKKMIVYPAVNFDMGSWVFRVTIDLSNSNIVNVFRFPVRS